MRTQWAAQSMISSIYFLNCKKELVTKKMKILWIFSESNLISSAFPCENQKKLSSFLPSKANSMHVSVNFYWTTRDWFHCLVGYWVLPAFKVLRSRNPQVWEIIPVVHTSLGFSNKTDWTERTVKYMNEFT